MKKPLSGDVLALEAMAAVEAVSPALEILDSRYKAFKFDVGDVIAGNSLSSGFLIGNWHAPDMDISNLGMVLAGGATAAIPMTAGQAVTLEVQNMGSMAFNVVE